MVAQVVDHWTAVPKVGSSKLAANALGYIRDHRCNLQADGAEFCRKLNSSKPLVVA